MPKVINLIVDNIIEAGIKMGFGIPGGVTPFLIEEFNKRKDFDFHITRHEGQAAVMADMYGRMTRKPGLLVGQGVWIATNGGFGIVEAYLAGSPMVIITEMSDWNGISLQAPYQCGSGEYGTVNLPNIFRSMTKYTSIATKPEEMVYAVQLALKHSISGRPGPACVITRWQTMMSFIEDPLESRPPVYEVSGHLRISPPAISEKDSKKIAKFLVEAKNPVLICGRGIHASNAYQEVKKIAELLGIPVATSYMGKSCIPETHRLACGVMGGLGQKLANQVIKEADVILAVGTCLAPDNTNSFSQDFIDIINQKLIHIDIEPRNAGWTYPVELGITSDAKLALQSIYNSIKKIGVKINVQDRIDELIKRKKDKAIEFFTSKYYNSDRTPIEPERVVKEINELIGENDLIVLDGGNNRMWFTKLFQTKKAGQLIGPGGAAGMAWCAGAASCAPLLYEKGKVLGIIGDGGLMMALYVLDFIKQYQLPVTYLIMNNSCFGNVRDFMTRKGRKLCEHPEQNFAKIANSMGIDAIRVEKLEDLRPAIEKGLKASGPMVLDVLISRGSHLRIRKSV
ncbi:MAG: hypothetical protein GF329_03735 [Candidatus Lokiarchaeota archaeon]|nr:hypothetical protein [Candidatus Lokiarchaeota archaeon]